MNWDVIRFFFISVWFGSVFEKLGFGLEWVWFWFSSVKKSGLVRILCYSCSRL